MQKGTKKQYNMWKTTRKQCGKAQGNNKEKYK